MTEIWKKGYEAGQESLLLFLEEMCGNIINIEDIKKDYKYWCEADEYTTCKGIVIKRYE